MPASSNAAEAATAATGCDRVPCGPAQESEQVLAFDEHWILVRKPAGLLAVPGRGEDKADCLIRRLQQRWPDALTVHRLDQPTSGLMVYARGAQAQRRLSQAFAERRVAKRYEAVVAGRLDGPGAGEAPACIDWPLSADWPRRPRQKVDPLQGKPALTRWRQLGPAPGGGTRVELLPETGRSHQLRVHLAALGHPILGDALYGDPAGAPRLLLHATRLELEHPQRGERCIWDDPAPF